MFVHGRGHRKTTQQRHYEKLREYATKLEEYVEKIKICGEERNSYSKIDHCFYWTQSLSISQQTEKSNNCRIGFHNSFSYGVMGVIHFFIKYNDCCIHKQKDA